MKASRAWFTLAACLLGVFAGWLLGRGSGGPPVATLPSQTDAASTSVAEAVAQPNRSSEAAAKAGGQPLQSSSEPGQIGGSIALTNSESPINSRDLDQNREWARTYPADAAAWLAGAPAGKQRAALAEIVCPGLAQTNAAAAVALAEKCAGGGSNSVAQFLLGNMVQQWAGQDMDAASVWVLAKPAGEERDQLLQHIAVVESQANPADAARLIVQQMQPGTTQDDAAISVLYQWARKDAPAALVWAQSFPPGDLRDRAISEVNNVSAVSAGNPSQN